MRGLKLKHGLVQLIWTQSHLLQMRGLKQAQAASCETGKASHLLQMRGLKPLKIDEKSYQRVASFTDAWIETWVKSTLIPSPSCRIFYRCVD